MSVAVTHSSHIVGLQASKVTVEVDVTSGLYSFSIVGLPDKAIDLIDEATSMLRMEIDSKPQSLDSLERKVMQLEIEKEAKRGRELTN